MTNLVGRDHAIGVLTGAVDALAVGRGSSLVLVGEAGIGKTALAGVAVDRAASVGATTVVGSSWEGAGAPMLWHWMQVVRASLRTEHGVRARATTGPGLDALLGESTPDGVASGSQAEFRIFDAIGSFLEQLARDQPVLVVLEDLHWADAASLRATDFVVRHLAHAPVLVVATHRSGATGSIGDSRVRDLGGVATVLALSGLGVEAVHALFASASGSALTEDEAHELHRRTGGNPFLVKQAAYLRAAGIELRSSAPGVRDMLEQRFLALDEGTRSVLRVAAVIGREFDVAVVSTVAHAVDASPDDASPDDAPTSISEAVAAGLVTVVPNEHAGFQHDLVREALLDELTVAETRAIHAAIAHTLRERGTAAPSVVAGHAVRALPDIDVDVVVGALLAAADDARNRQAADEEVDHLCRAFELASADERSELAVRLGAALLRSGRLAGAEVFFRERLGEARAARDRELFAEMALGLQAIGTAIEGPDSLVDLLDEAAELMSDTEPSAVTARVWAAQTQALAHTVGADRDRSLRIGRDAVDLARRLGDDRALGTCLVALHDSIWDMHTGPERLAITAELSEVAQRLGDTELTLLAGHLRVAALLELGRPEARGEHRAVSALARWSHLPRPNYLSLVREATFATMDGEFERALDVIDEAHRLATRIEEPDRDGLAMDQRYLVMVLLGRADEMADELARARLGGDPHIVMLEAASSFTRGDHTDAADRLPELEALGRMWPRWAQAVGVATLARVAIATGREEQLHSLLAEIEQVSDRCIVLGGTISFDGPFRYWRGLLLLALGERDDAIDELTTAAQMARRLAAPVWEVTADVERLDLLLERGSGTDRAEAAHLHAALASNAVACRMPHVVDRLGAAEALLTATPVGGAANVFRRDGAVWTLSCDGLTASMPDSKGLTDLHQLVASPGVEIAATDLLHAGDAAGASAQRALGADAVLDDTARRAYRRRLTELDEAIDEALTRRRDAAAMALEHERDALLAELSRATGLGGRRRRLGDDAERARKTVTARIKDVLRRMEEQHPPMAAHLRASVSTGSKCRYQPPRSTTWEL